MAVEPLSKVAPAIVGALVASYGVWAYARTLTTPPRTLTREWAAATDKQLDAWPREAAGPVAVNPISRGNYSKA